MTNLSLIFLFGVMICVLEKAYSNNFYYYPNSQGALSYQYPPFSPYVYSAYAVPVNCDQNTDGGSSESSSESSSSESSSSETTEETSSEGSTEGNKGESSSSEEDSGASGDAKKSNPQQTSVKYIFPAPVYSFPPQSAPQVVYSAPASYPYMPYKTYSLMQQPASYPVKSGGYSNYPYYSNYPVSAGYSGPVAKNYASPASPVSKIVSSPVSYPAVSKTITFSPASGAAGPSGYWNGNTGYYRV